MGDKRQLVEYTLEDGTSVQIESLVDPSAGGEMLVADDQSTQGGARLDALLKNVQPTIQALHQSLVDINNPAEITLEVGLDLKAGAGVVFASAESTCTFKASFKWINTPSH